MKKRKIFTAIMFATFGALAMSCSEEEVKPTINNSLEVATEGNKGGHDEPPVENP